MTTSPTHFKDLPSKNVHTSELLDRVAQAIQPDVPDFANLCGIAVDLQKSLRAANSDSPRINSDPAFRLVMIHIGHACQVRDFSDYVQAMSEIEKNIESKNAFSQRANWAQMAQEGASNLTPLTTSLQKACAQVLSEGSDPSKDPAVRLLAHQMAHLASTILVEPKTGAAKELSSWCDAHRARNAVDQMEAELSNKKLPAP